MKKVLMIALVICSQITMAQVTKNLGDFNAISIFDKLNVKLIPGSENKIVIKGTRASEVETVNNNGVLKVRMPFPKLMSGNDIMIQLYYKNIDDISASEGSFVSSDAVFKATIMNVSAREGAQIEVELDAEKVNVKAVTGGIVNLSGEANNQDVAIGTGGNLSAIDLRTSQTTVTVSAGGTAEVYATTLVDAKVRAGGNIYIYGKPKQVNKATVLGGKIEEKN
ncbi:chaperonin [Flavobacterium faecale]|uniref:Chaperonin n=1 Tax=Flavobacterium faecale TaxID=1355330 RepID=A0A2S1LAV0_9FLAO|nr:head GIN domain-containing protein [Flavobacterium faecale]AWG20854.1 chaperonin [Flavobacterium faecale]